MVIILLMRHRMLLVLLLRLFKEKKKRLIWKEVFRFILCKFNISTVYPGLRLCTFMLWSWKAALGCIFLLQVITCEYLSYFHNKLKKHFMSMSIITIVLFFTVRFAYNFMGLGKGRICVLFRRFVEIHISSISFPPINFS